MRSASDVSDEYKRVEKNVENFRSQLLYFISTDVSSHRSHYNKQITRQGGSFVINKKQNIHTEWHHLQSIMNCIYLNASQK